jgi:hypothetical protein
LDEWLSVQVGRSLKGRGFSSVQDVALAAVSECYDVSNPMIIRPEWRKRLLAVLLCFALAYAGFAALIWWAMHQPPENFARVMSRLPGPVAFLIFPFETAWTRARAGQLQVGDLAPDFTLKKHDKSGAVQLSALTAQRPVVLVFGSYT